ncbi:hypothetical protein THAOC_37858, partial [Thalassiosira oceanica]
ERTQYRTMGDMQKAAEARERRRCEASNTGVIEVQTGVHERAKRKFKEKSRHVEEVRREERELHRKLALIRFNLSMIPIVRLLKRWTAATRARLSGTTDDTDRYLLVDAMPMSSTVKNPEPPTRLFSLVTSAGLMDKTSGVKAHPAPDDNCTLYPRHLIGSITGPEGTAYEGGVFEVDILISKEYPFEPPKMKFTTKIWHPNVSSQTGAICLVSWTTWCFIPSAQRRLLRD